MLNRQPSLSARKQQQQQQQQRPPVPETPSTTSNTVSSSQWLSPPSLTTYLRNLRLLNLDTLNDWPQIDVHTFQSKDARPRLRAVEWSLYHLFRIYDAKETNDKLRPFFPPLEPLQSVNLRAALFRTLSDLKKNGILGRETILRKSMLDDCKGERFEEILAAFSTVVLRKVVAASGNPAGKWVMEQESANLVPLLLAHAGSVRGFMGEKVQQDERYRGFANLLRAKEELLKERKKGIQKEADASYLDEDLQRQIKRTWLGNDRWADIVLSGGLELENDALLELPFSEIWTEVSKGNMKDIGSQKSRDLLSELDGRVAQQQQRLKRWKDFESSLQGGEEEGKDSEKELAKAAKPEPLMVFRSHQQLNLSTVVKARLQPKKVAMMPQYESIIDSMTSALDQITRSGSKRRRNTDRRPAVAEKMIDHRPAISEDQVMPPTPISNATLQEVMTILKNKDNERQKSAIMSPYFAQEVEDQNAGSQEAIELSQQVAKPGNLSPLDSGELSARFNQAISLDGPSESSADYFQRENSVLDVPRPSNPTAMSPLQREELDISLDIQSSYSPPRSSRSIPSISGPLSPGADEDTVEAALDFPKPSSRPEAHSNLIERTRQSMSLLPDAQTIRRQSLALARKQARESRQVYPVNQFGEEDEDDDVQQDIEEEQEDTRSGSLEPEPQSRFPPRASTPRDELFNQDADYNSVFKSRPRIAVSPTPDATRNINAYSYDGSGVDESPSYDDEDGDDNGYTPTPGTRFGLPAPAASRGGRRVPRESLGIGDLLDGLEESSMIQDLDVGSSPLGPRSRDVRGYGARGGRGLRY